MLPNQSSFICQHENCNKYFKEPVILPCGLSICKEHIDDLVKSKKKKFKCSFCNKDHLSSQNYQLNVSLNDIMNWEKSYLNQNQIEIRKLLRNFEQTLNELSKINNDPADYLYEYVNEQKRRVELQREELKLEIDKIAQELIEKIDKLKSEFSINIASNINLDKYKTTIQEYEKEHMRNPNLCKKDLVKLVSNLSNLKEEAESNLWNLKRKLRNDTTFEFESNTKKFKPSRFGSLVVRPDVRLIKSKEIKCLKKEVYSAIYYPPNKLISGSLDEIKIWDLNTKKCLLTLSKQNVGKITKLVLNPDNSKLITASQDKEYEEIFKIHVICLIEFKFLATISHNFTNLLDLCLLPNGCLLTSCVSRGLLVWSMKDYRFKKELPKHLRFFENFNFTSDNQKLVGNISELVKSAIVILDVETLASEYRLPEFQTNTYCVKLLSDDQTVISGHDDGIRIWDLVEKKLVRMIWCYDSIKSIGLIQNEMYLLAFSDYPSYVYLCNLNNENEYQTGEPLNCENKNTVVFAGLLPNEDIISISEHKICIYDNLFKNYKN